MEYITNTTQTHRQVNAMTYIQKTGATDINVARIMNCILVQ